MDHEAKVPTVGIMLVDRDHCSIQLVRLAVYNGSANSEFGNAIAAVSFRMDFHNFGDVASESGSETLAVVSRERYSSVQGRTLR
jgi:hypothetical protein